MKPPGDPIARRPAELLPILLESTTELGLGARFAVAGSSMMPLIRPDDVVHVGPVVGAALRAGDVVVVRRAQGDGLLVHRVIGLTNGAVVVRGDNTRTADGVFKFDDVIGVVESIWRGNREVWFGAGWAGPLVGMAVRIGALLRFNQVAFPVYRSLTQRRHRGRGK